MNEYSVDFKLKIVKMILNDEDVTLFAKLPKRFIIDTPFGTYNPDWIVVIQSSSEELYFVAETKGTDIIEDLRESEKNKILCGDKHFKVLDQSLKYELVKDFKSLRRKN